MDIKKRIDEADIGELFRIIINFLVFFEEAPTDWWNKKDIAGELVTLLQGSHSVDTVWFFTRLPILSSYGVDMVHFGVVMTLNVIIGMLTPPLGVTLYISSDIVGVPFEKIIKHIIPFYMPLLIVLFLIIYIPQLVLWLPNLLMP
jgi:TRAP-type mannitol/chloroaromatic compound transport system permease large subunit